MDTTPKVLHMVGQANFAKPVVAAANAGACTIVTDVSISTLTLGALTVAAQPDCPRTMRAVVTDANATITGGTVTIVGQDQNGDNISDVIAITGAGSFDGAKAFAKVVSATWALTGGTVTTTDDKVAIGYGPALGLQAPIGAKYDRLIKGVFDGLDDLGTFSKTYGLYTPAGTMNGAKTVVVSFLYKLLLSW
jgi:hypothetical protein